MKGFCIALLNSSFTKRHGCNKITICIKDNMKRNEALNAEQPLLPRFSTLRNSNQESGNLDSISSKTQFAAILPEVQADSIRVTSRASLEFAFANT